ncbi:conserved uncharacterized protein (C-terminal fragment), partial [Ustilago hordei]
ALTDKGAPVILDHASGQIHLVNGTSLKVSKNSKHGLLELQSEVWQESAMTTSAQPFEGVDKEFEPIVKKHTISTQQLWHECLGHPGRDKAKAIIKKIGGNIQKDLDPDTALTCEQCIQSKSMATRMGQGSGERAAAPLNLIHIDLIIDALHATKHTCILVLIDDHSKYVYAQPLLQKSQAFMQLRRIVSFLETQTRRNLKAIQLDQGTEWRSNEALEWSQDKGIEWQTTVGYNSKQNGRVEQMNRSLSKKM